MLQGKNQESGKRTLGIWERTFFVCLFVCFPLRKIGCPILFSQCLFVWVSVDKSCLDLQYYLKENIVLWYFFWSIHCELRDICCCYKLIQRTTRNLSLDDTDFLLAFIVSADSAIRAHFRAEVKRIFCVMLLIAAVKKHRALRCWMLSPGSSLSVSLDVFFGHELYEHRQLRYFVLYSITNPLRNKMYIILSPKVALWRNALAPIFCFHSYKTHVYTHCSHESKEDFHHPSYLCKSLWLPVDCAASKSWFRWDNDGNHSIYWCVLVQKDWRLEAGLVCSGVQVGWVHSL